MQIYMQGQADPKLMYENTTKVVANLLERLEVPEDTKLFIEDLSFKVSFEINGQLQYASITRDINGEKVPEIFQVAVKLDPEGRIVYVGDNEDESFYDGYTLAQAVGQEYEYEGIESLYPNEDLEVISYLESSEDDEKKVMAVTYKIKGDDDFSLIRYYKGEKIVAEKLVSNEINEEN